MTDQQDKPAWREWRILFDRLGFPNLVADKPLHKKHEFDEVVHVVERAALDAALAEIERLKIENDKLTRLLNGEEVELECKAPGYNAVVKLSDDKTEAVLIEAWDKRSR